MHDGHANCSKVYLVRPTVPFRGSVEGSVDGSVAGSLEGSDEGSSVDVSTTVIPESGSVGILSTVLIPMSPPHARRKAKIIKTPLYFNK
tara:strand:+ start:225 stop:491 length:267 start_codon:yes stop_codon:yes gene_type:complete